MIAQIIGAFASPAHRRTLLVAAATAVTVLTANPVPAQAAASHTVSITCTVGSGWKVQAAVNAAVGDSLTVMQSGCVWFDVIPGKAVPTGGSFTRNGVAGYNTSSGSTITFSITTLMTTGESIVYFAPTAQSNTPPADHAYVVMDSRPESRPLRYVALGDSYSAGEGAGAGNYFQTNGVDIPCHRAPTAWSFRLTKISTQFQRPMENAACTGAVISDVITHYYKGEQPQVNRLRELQAASPVDLVTLTIGGNDIGFGDIARNCYVADCTSELLNKADKIAAMRDRVTRLVIPALKGAAPTAQVVIVGYPRLLPVQQRDAVNCGWLEPGERVLLNTLVADINLALRKAAKAADAKYVDVTDALDGHEMCSRDSHVVRIYGNKFNSEQAHPNKDGQLDYAQAVFTGLKKLGINSR